MLVMGLPMGLQFSITAIGTIIVQGAVNVYGENYMAGFSAAGKLQNIVATVYVASERPLPLMWDKTGEQARRNACLWA